MEHPGSRRNRGDPYDVLGVSPDASQRDIARAYRRAVQRAHPDAQPEDPQASARFQALTDAYDLLSDPGRRADYDRGYPARVPSGQASQPAHTCAMPRWRGSPPLLPGPPRGQPIWAGPVRVEPPAAAPSSDRDRRGPMAAAEYEDPVVILGVRSGQAWARVW